MSVGPGVCELTQDGSRLTQDCGGGFVYTGTRTGDSFSMTLERGVIPDPLGFCGDIYVHEEVSGTFTSDTTWVGMTNVLEFNFMFEDEFCSPCALLPYETTASKIE